MMTTLNMRIMSLMTGLIMGLTISCGAKTNTGRNADPTKWPTDDQTSRGPSHDHSEGSSESGRGEVNAGCFDKTTRVIPEGIAKLCAEKIKPEPAFKDIYPIICEDGKVIAVLEQPSCGWDGNSRTLKNFIHHYYVQKDPALDYEDVHASFLHAPIPVDQYINIIRLAFENYDEFKARGYRWISGTREHRNLSGTKWEDGVQYRFRADKDVYEIGYQGTTTIYQISPKLSVHLNRATGDFARVAEFAQVVIYQEQADHTSVSFKVEHRRISSQGLYERAKKSSDELVRDLMERGYKNASKR